MRVHVTVLLAALAAGLLSAREARACGACLLPMSESPSVVNAHRMVLSLSQERTILWDQIQYDGSPSEWAWVLPVFPGTQVQTGTDAFVDMLEAGTATLVNAPPLNCQQQGFSGGGVGCGTSGGEDDNNSRGFVPGQDAVSGVAVLSRQSVGPYEAVTLRGTDGAELLDWLNNNGYQLPASLEPVIQDYALEGLDFLALRLRPDVGVQQMKPIRIVYPGMFVTLPLRMVAGGVGARVALTLFILGEGRWQSASTPNVEVNPANIQWNFALGASNHQDLRRTLLNTNAGNVWLTSYARRGSLWEPTTNPRTNAPQTYSVRGNSITVDTGNPVGDGATATTLAQAFALQAQARNEGDAQECLTAFETARTSNGRVVDPCDATGASCRALEPNEVDMRTLRCGAADDLAQALVGMRLGSVWVTRLEADLPASALSQDLRLEAAASQVAVENNVVAPLVSNEPCPVATAAAPQTDRPMGVLASVFFAPLLGVLSLRRALRRRPTA